MPSKDKTIQKAYKDKVITKGQYDKLSDGLLKGIIKKKTASGSGGRKKPARGNKNRQLDLVRGTKKTKGTKKK